MMREGALALVRAGFQVFPVYGIVDGVCTCGQRPGCSPGKHPLPKHGHKEASSDPKQIAAWWKRWPNANVGVATGGPHHLLVIDCDPRNGGPTSFEELQEIFPTIPVGGVRVRTGGGGLHVYLKYSGGPIPAKLAAGIDLKGEGGYVVAPPSLHGSGRRYEFETLGAAVE
jgi:hypothetical protein